MSTAAHAAPPGKGGTNPALAWGGMRFRPALIPVVTTVADGSADTESILGEISPDIHERILVGIPEKFAHLLIVDG